MHELFFHYFKKIQNGDMKKYMKEFCTLWNLPPKAPFTPTLKKEFKLFMIKKMDEGYKNKKNS